MILIALLHVKKVNLNSVKMRLVFIMIVGVVWLTACNNFIVNRRPDLTPSPPDVAPYEPQNNIPVPQEGILVPPEQERAKQIDLDWNREIPPGVYRIKGTVMQVYPIKVDDTEMCAKAPCLAAVRVDTIIGRGATTETGLLRQGQQVDVYFRYSTAATAELFPEVQPALPGVDKGTPFTADIALAPESSNGRKVFELYNYEVPK